MERNAADLDDPPLTTSLSLSASTRGSYLFYSPPISLTRVRIGFLHVGESFLLFFSG
ncbi:Uncharacterized protein APZ42_029105 [Daphnia magna]|uniref:Uncharacterized protein n=1 Tax=Daphnia magna TaxID=35525 RepID=A0A164PXD4_9CRUS|nr:Uncharacterized protein APZ42_029105 [Daphnia magna]